MKKNNPQRYKNGEIDWAQVFRLCSYNQNV